jgi:hypothetical protein
MEYRGIPYQVVQTANPTGWKWTVNGLGQKAKTGTSFTRAAAERAAQRQIDKSLKKLDRALPHGGGGRIDRTFVAAGTGVFLTAGGLIAFENAQSAVKPR